MASNLVYRMAIANMTMLYILGYKPGRKHYFTSNPFNMATRLGRSVIGLIASPILAPIVYGAALPPINFSIFSIFERVSGRQERAAAERVAVAQRAAAAGRVASETAAESEEYLSAADLSAAVTRSTPRPLVAVDNIYTTLPSQTETAVADGRVASQTAAESDAADAAERAAVQRSERQAREAARRAAAVEADARDREWLETQKRAIAFSSSSQIQMVVLSPHEGWQTTVAIDERSGMGSVVERSRQTRTAPYQGRRTTPV